MAEKNQLTIALDPARWDAGDYETSLRRNTVIDGRFRLQDLLAVEPAAEVYRATLELAPMLSYVVKIVRPSVPNLAIASRRLRSEAEGLCAVNSDCIAKSRGSGLFEGERFYLTRDFVRAEPVRNLQALFASLDHVRCERYVTALCAAVRAAHAVGNRFGVIAPEHIVILSDEPMLLASSVKLLTAGTRDGRESFELAYNAEWLASYIAPEVRERPIGTVAGDVYSIGAVLAFSLCHQEIDREGPGAQLESLKLPIGRALAPVIERACAQNPNERFPDVGALLNGFREAFGSLQSMPRRGSAAAVRALAPERGTEPPHRRGDVDELPAGYTTELSRVVEPSTDAYQIIEEIGSPSTSRVRATTDEDAPDGATGSRDS